MASFKIETSCSWFNKLETLLVIVISFSLVFFFRTLYFSPTQSLIFRRKRALCSALFLLGHRRFLGIFFVLLYLDGKSRKYVAHVVVSAVYFIVILQGVSLISWP